MGIRRRIVALLALTLVGCVEYYPYDTRTKGEKGINAKNIARIEQTCQDKLMLRFAVVTDSQRFYDELAAAVSLINEREDIDFVIHTGDVSDFGIRSEFEAQRDILNKLDVPYVCLIGNHDCIATGKELFADIFGATDMSFVAGNVNFVCLNTNSLEYDEDENVPNIAFVEQVLSSMPERVEKSVVAMHAHPLSDQFYDEERARELQQSIKRLPNLQFCVHGHGHRYQTEDIFGDGVIYYECDNVGDRSLLVFTINDESYECEKIDF